MTDVLAQATQALRTLYGASGVTSAARRSADTWLQEFQRQDAAWVVSDRLLASGDQTLQFFAAKTMQRKVAFDPAGLLRSLCELRRCSASCQRRSPFW